MVIFTPRDLFKQAADVPDILFDFMRCDGAGGRVGGHAAARLRAGGDALRSDTAGALPAKSFDGARVYQRPRGVADS